MDEYLANSSIPVRTSEASLNSTGTDNDTAGVTGGQAAAPLQLPVYMTGTVSLATYTAFLRYYSQLALFTCLLGVAGSLLNVLVYLHQHRSGGGAGAGTARTRDVYVSFLVGIALCDGLFALSKAIGYAIAIAPPNDDAADAYSDLLLDIYASSAFRRCAVWLNALASLERFLTIAFPLGTASYVFRRAPHLVIAGVVLATCAMHLSMFFEFRVEMTGPHTWRQTTSQQRHADPDLFVVINNVTRIAFFYVPLFGSLVVNLALMAALQRHAAGKRSMTASRGGAHARPADTDLASGAPKMKARKDSSTETQAAKLILVLSLTFFLLALPSTLNASVGSFHAQYGVMKKEMFLYALFLYCFNFPMFLTQAAIFCINLGYSARFRAACADLLTRRRTALQHKQGAGQSATGSDVSSAVTALSTAK